MAWSCGFLSLCFSNVDYPFDLSRKNLFLVGDGSCDIWDSIQVWFGKDWLRLSLGLAGLIWVAFLSLNRLLASMSWFLALAELMIFLPVLFPGMVVTAWRDAQLTSGFERSLDAFITGVCGMAIGIIIARLASPKLFGAFDQKLLARDPTTACVRQWIGTMAVTGALLGWQAMTSIGAIVGLISIVVSCFTKFWRPTLDWNAWTVWVWLSVLIYISFSSLLINWWPVSLSMSPVAGHISAAIAVYVLAIFWKLIQPEDKSPRHPETLSRES